MPGIIDLLTAPPSNQLDELMRILARHQLMQTGGDVATKWLFQDKELEDLQRESLRLDVASKKRSLGMNYRDDEEFERDTNDKGRDRATVGMGGEMARRAREIKPYAPKKLPETGLQAIFKTAFAEIPPPPALAKGIPYDYGSKLLSAVLRR